MGRPRSSIYDYNASKVKTANERLRKLQKVYDNARQSAGYRIIERNFTEQPNGRGWLYSDTTKTGKDRGYIGFKTMNKKEWAGLTDEQKKAYNVALEKWLSSDTSTKLGIEMSFEKARQTYLSNHPEAREWLTMDKYKELWERKQELQDRLGDHFDYSRFMMTVNVEAGLYNVLSDNITIDDLTNQFDRTTPYGDVGHKFRLTYKRPKTLGTDTF